MTYAHTRDGGVIHFPPSLQTDAGGVIVPPAIEALPDLAGAIASGELLRFASLLVRSARRRRFETRWGRVNQVRLHLARLCLERAEAEGLALQ